jgi:hypothetical protein
MSHRCSCLWSLTAAAPTASPSGRVSIDAPWVAPRNRWQALRNRLNHASYADWPRLCWQAATPAAPSARRSALASWVGTDSAAS